MVKYCIIFEKTVDGYSAYVPDLEGCVSCGETKEEAEHNIYEAIKFHIEGLILEGYPIPQPKTESENIVLELNS